MDKQIQNNESQFYDTPSNMTEAEKSTKKLVTTNNITILYSKVSKDGNYLLLGLDKGFMVVSLPDGSIKCQRSLRGGIGKLAWIENSNIFALVGGGRFPFEVRTKVVIWDEKLGKRITTITYHPDMLINNLAFSRDYLVVALGPNPGTENKDNLNYIMLYSVSEKKGNFEHLDKLATIKNPRGVFSLCEKNFETLIAYPYLKNQEFHTGNLEIRNITKPGQTINLKAHKNIIWQICFSRSGNYIATCSRKGTMIRIWEALSGNMACEIRRGFQKENLHDLSFDDDDFWLICCNDGRAINIYDINKRIKKDTHEEYNSPLDENILRRLVNYLSSREHSFAWLQVKCEEKDKAIITSEGHIIYFSSKGIIKKYQFDKFNGGNAGWIEPDVRLLENARFQMIIDKTAVELGDVKPELSNLENILDSFNNVDNKNHLDLSRNNIPEVIESESESED